MSVGVVVNSPASTPATMDGMISLFRLSFVRLPCGLRSRGMVDLRLPPCLWVGTFQKYVEFGIGTETGRGAFGLLLSAQNQCGKVRCDGVGRD
jgi:hypothetical protein